MIRFDPIDRGQQENKGKACNHPCRQHNGGNQPFLVVVWIFLPPRRGGPGFGGREGPKGMMILSFTTHGFFYE